MKKLSTAEEIAQAMRDNLQGDSCPTTPDKIQALELLSYAAQLFDTTGHSLYADKVDSLINKLASKSESAEKEI